MVRTSCQSKVQYCDTLSNLLNYNATASIGLTNKLSLIKMTSNMDPSNISPDPMSRLDNGPPVLSDATSRNTGTSATDSLLSTKGSHQDSDPSQKQPHNDESGDVDSVIKYYNHQSDPPTGLVQHGTGVDHRGWTIQWLTGEIPKNRTFKVSLYLRAGIEDHQVTPAAIGSTLKGIVPQGSIDRIKAAMEWVNRTTEN